LKRGKQRGIDVNIGDFQGNETILYGTILMDIFVKAHRTMRHSEVQCKLLTSVIIM
jgi:hypothetical protein